MFDKIKVPSPKPNDWRNSCGVACSIFASLRTRLMWMRSRRTYLQFQGIASDLISFWLRYSHAKHYVKFCKMAVLYRRRFSVRAVGRSSHFKQIPSLLTLPYRTPTLKQWQTEKDSGWLWVWRSWPACTLSLRNPTHIHGSIYCPWGRSATWVVKFVVCFGSLKSV